MTVVAPADLLASAVEAGVALAQVVLARMTPWPKRTPWVTSQTRDFLTPAR